MKFAATLAVTASTAHAIDLFFDFDNFFDNTFNGMEKDIFTME